MSETRSSSDTDTDTGAASGHEPGVGTLLRASRLRFGEDLRDVAQMLRIRYPYLEAIEAGRYGDLPGPAYAVGFVRAYAEHLGLDAAEVVRRFKTETENARDRTELTFPSPISERSTPGAAILFIGVLVVAVVYGVWYVGSAEEGFFADLVAPLPERLAALLPGDDAPPPATDAAGPAEPAATPATSEPEATGADTQLVPPERVPEAAPQTEAAPAAETRPVVPAPGASVTEEAGAETAIAEPEPAAPAATVTEEADAETAIAEPGPAAPAATVTEEADAEIAIAEPEPPAPAATVSEETDAETAIAEPEPAAPATAEPALPAEPETAPAVAELVVPAQPETAPAASADATPAEPVPTPTAPAEPSVAETATAEPTPTAPAEPTEPAMPPIPDPAVTPPAQQTQTPAESVEAAEPAAEVAAIPEAPEPVAETAGTGRVYGANNEDSRIVVRAKIDSWIQVRDGVGRRLLLTRLLRAGDSYRVPDQEGLTLLTGNAGALDILVDGEPVPSIGPLGAVRRNVALDVERLQDGTAVLD